MNLRGGAPGIVALQGDVLSDNWGMDIKPIDERNSHVLRTGLPKGSQAPAIDLPGLDGDTVCLNPSDMKSPTLVVFSSTDCGPCDAVLKALPEVAKFVPQLSVLVVSHGSKEDVLEKRRHLEIQWPIAVQHNKEVSRSYGVFATPAAILVNRNGLVGADPAIGMVAIVRLVLATAIMQLVELTEQFDHSLGLLAAAKDVDASAHNEDPAESA